MSAQQCLLTVTDPRRTPELNRVFPFTLASVTYTLVGLRTIRNLIMQGLVYAMEDRSLGDYASYRSRGTSGPTVMRIGFSEFGNDAAVRQERKGTILHECIHAMQDNAAATWMRVDTAEAAAYTAQFLFLRACGRPRGVRSGIRFWGWAAAERIERSPSRSIALHDIGEFLNAIRQHHLYQASYDITGRYDGIARPAR